MVCTYSLAVGIACPTSNHEPFCKASGICDMTSKQNMFKRTHGSTFSVVVLILDYLQFLKVMPGILKVWTP